MYPFTLLQVLKIPKPLRKLQIHLGGNLRCSSIHFQYISFSVNKIYIKQLVYLYRRIYRYTNLDKHTYIYIYNCIMIHKRILYDLPVLYVHKHRPCYSVSIQTWEPCILTLSKYTRPLTICASLSKFMSEIKNAHAIIRQ